MRFKSIVGMMCCLLLMRNGGNAMAPYERDQQAMQQDIVGRARTQFTGSEDATLLTLRIANKDWDYIARSLGKSKNECMLRWLELFERGAFQPTAGAEQRVAFQPASGVEQRVAFQLASRAEQRVAFQPAFGVEQRVAFQPAFGVEQRVAFQPAFGVEQGVAFQPASGVEQRVAFQPASGVEQRVAFQLAARASSYRPFTALEDAIIINFRVKDSIDVKKVKSLLEDRSLFQIQARNKELLAFGLKPGTLEWITVVSMLRNSFSPEVTLKNLLYKDQQEQARQKLELVKRQSQPPMYYPWPQ